MTSFSALPAVSFGAHRGGRNTAPENTITAFRAARDAGVDWIEMDARCLGDGTPVVFHDATTDRVIGRPGGLDSLTAQALATLRTLPGLPAPAWQGERLPTVAQVLDELGGTVVMVIEAKEPEAIAPIAALVRERDLGGSVVLSSHRPADIAAIRAEGLLSLLWRGDADGSQADAEECAAAAPDVLQVRYTWPDELIAEYAAAVPQAVLWSDCGPRRVQRDRLIGLGVTGIVSDEPVYLAGRSRRMRVDAWRWGTWGHGDCVSVGVRPEFTRWGGLELRRNGHVGVLVGGSAGVDSCYSVGLDVMLATPAAAGTPWVGVLVSAPDDRAWQDSGSDGTSGYACLLNAVGNAYVYRRDGGSATRLGVVDGPPLELGRTYRLQVRVSADTVTLEVPGQTAPLTVQDATHRGPYLHVGAKGDGVAAWHVGSLTVDG